MMRVSIYLGLSYCANAGRNAPCLHAPAYASERSGENDLLNFMSRARQGAFCRGNLRVQRAWKNVYAFFRFATDRPSGKNFSEPRGKKSRESLYFLICIQFPHKNESINFFGTKILKFGSEKVYTFAFVCNSHTK